LKFLVYVSIKINDASFTDDMWWCELRSFKFIFTQNFSENRNNNYDIFYFTKGCPIPWFTLDYSASFTNFKLRTVIILIPFKEFMGITEDIPFNINA